MPYTARTVGARRRRAVAGLAAALLLVTGCAGTGAPAAGETGEVVTMYVAEKRQPCIGEGEMSCLRVRSRPDAPWELFYDDIAGFDWVEGTTYELRVQVTEVEDPPADGSSLAYELVEVVSEAPA